MGASMQLPGGAAWVPQTPGSLTPAATPNSAMPQAIAYPTMQQFQVSPQVSFSTFFHFSAIFSLVRESPASENKLNLINFLKIYVFHSNFLPFSRSLASTQLTCLGAQLGEEEWITGPAGLLV
jgi:hypothetical protein